jgi:hypothetical protein
VLQQFRGLFLAQLQAAGVARVEILEPEALAFADAERVDVLAYPVEDFFFWHAAPFVN